MEDLVLVKEKDDMRKYLIENSLYNEKILLCIISHYRNLIKPQKINSNFVTIMTTILTIALPFLGNAIS